MYTFKSSPIWEVVRGANTFNNFCENLIPIFHFNENVPEPITRRFGIIRKLLEFSYFEYEFIDVAMEKSFQTFELALHMKFRIENPDKIDKKNFKPYLDWAVKSKHLKITNNNKKVFEYLRNHVTHLKYDSINGMVGLNTIKVIGNDIINKLFARKIG